MLIYHPWILKHSKVLFLFIGVASNSEFLKSKTQLPHSIKLTTCIFSLKRVPNCKLNITYNINQKNILSKKKTKKITILHIDLSQGCKCVSSWIFKFSHKNKNAFEDGRQDKRFLCNSSSSSSSSSSSLIPLKS